MRTRFGLIATSIALSALAALPATGFAARVGAVLPGTQNGTHGCSVAAGCVFFQSKLGGQPVRAPFSGTATKLKIQNPTGTFSLLVLRKTPEGEFRHVRSSPPRPMSGGDSEVVPVEVDLRVRHRDYLGVLVPDGATLAGLTDGNEDNCRTGLAPPPLVGESSLPNPSYTNCGIASLYSVALRR